MKTTIYLLFIVVFAVGCRPIRLSTQPTPGVTSTAPEVQDSKIFVPFSIDLKEIEKQVNEAMPSGRIYRDKEGCEREEYEVNVYRNKPVKVSASGGKLIFKTDLQVKAKGKYCAGVWTDNWACSCCCAGAHPSGSANSVVEVKIEVDLKMNEDYKITAKTQLDGKIIKGKHVKIKLLGFTINIKVEDLVGPIKKKLKPMEASLNKQIQDELNKLNVKEELAKAWKDAHQVIPVGYLFLHVTPQNVFFQNIYAQNGKVNLGIGVSTKLVLKSEDGKIEPTPFPKLTIVDSNEEGKFFVHLPAETSFENINSSLNFLYADQKYEYGNNWVKIKNIDVKGIELGDNAPALWFDVEISGKVSRFRKVKGHLYFTGKPVLDNMMIRMDEFKMNSNTNSEVINKGVEVLVNRFYYDDISRYQVYRFDNDVYSARRVINKYLSAVDLGGYVAKMKLEELLIKSLFITDKVIGVDAQCSGTVETVEIKDEE